MTTSQKLRLIKKISRQSEVLTADLIELHEGHHGTGTEEDPVLDARAVITGALGGVWHMLDLICRSHKL